MTVVVVTGTSTGIGKTTVTAALAAVARNAGLRVCAIKPAQTGVGTGEPTDMTVVSMLSGGIDVHELTRLEDPLAPDTAARLRRVAIPTVEELAADVARIATDHDLTLVEGAGGVAVRLDTNGGTLLTLAGHLAEASHDVRVVVVTSLALGTLNHTELTVAAVRAAGLMPCGLIIGAQPPELGLAEECNVDELPRVTGVPLLAALPSGVGRWAPARFQDSAPEWLPASSLSRLWGDPASGRGGLGVR